MDYHYQPEYAHNRARQGIKVVRHSIGFNLLLVVVKLLAGILGHSYALIADAIESASDVLGSVVVWIGLNSAARPPDKEHPYGHGKAEPIAAVVVSILLFLAGIFIAYQAFHNIATPHRLPEVWTLWILAFIIVFKELVFRYVMKTGNAIESQALKGEAQHQRSDALTSLTAFVGICIAIIGGNGYESADDWAALFASLVVGWNAWGVFRPAFSELMDEALPTEVVLDIRKIASEVPGVIDVEKCFVRKMGFELFVDIHLVVNGQLTVAEGHHIAHQVKDKIIEQRPQVYDVLTHVEPASLEFMKSVEGQRKGV
jgi:cation diffusion facilitator family transporter